MPAPSACSFSAAPAIGWRCAPAGDRDTIRAKVPGARAGTSGRCESVDHQTPPHRPGSPTSARLQALGRQTAAGAAGRAAVAWGCGRQRQPLSVGHSRKLRMAALVHELADPVLYGSAARAEDRFMRPQPRTRQGTTRSLPGIHRQHRWRCERGRRPSSINLRLEVRT